jgi:hypothetical protein
VIQTGPSIAVLYCFPPLQLDEAQKKVVERVARSGQALEGHVTYVKDFGVIVDLGNDLTGFATKGQSAGVECSSGAPVTARALDMDLDKKVRCLGYRRTDGCELRIQPGQSAGRLREAFSLYAIVAAQQIYCVASLLSVACVRAVLLH